MNCENMGFSGVYGVAFLSMVLLISLSVLYGTVESNLNMYMAANDDHVDNLLQKSKENLTIQYQSIDDTGFLNITVINNGRVLEDTSKWTVLFEGTVENDLVIENTYLEPLSRTSLYIQTIYNSSTIHGKRVVISGEFGEVFVKEL